METTFQGPLKHTRMGPRTLRVIFQPKGISSSFLSDGNADLWKVFVHNGDESGVSPLDVHRGGVGAMKLRSSAEEAVCSALPCLPGHSTLPVAEVKPWGDPWLSPHSPPGPSANPAGSALTLVRSALHPWSGSWQLSPGLMPLPP